MRMIVVAGATAAALFAAMPPSTNLANAQEVDIRVGGPRGPGVVIDTDGRRYRDRDCRTVRITEWRDGVRITRTERRCD